MWVFRKMFDRDKEVDIFQVGYFHPDGDFIIMYETVSRVDAAGQVHFLNGGN